ncbi:IclR family transcriptional regulator [Rhodococcus artemisiae]|uniref:Helix-turn-helix domain-containing protein n=1 Tax=Rhodococcus artemisiae TaxID=714159 RepID=A0ABU7L8D1_9NOCA|nr:helix-turn-helix domain-containing protein [Rhodococcus artemisiae]MEE2057788.1 helix-turn-helix domain-containing protein [Rhodococcus artemisiae]
MALSARRALQVLDFLTANQRGTFTLSELSRALDVSPGSMFAVLKVMNDEGYVSRHPRHKTYTLGPAAAAVGHASVDAHPVIELARIEMVNLAESTGLECTGTVQVGRDVLCISVEGKPTGRSVELAPGQRMPLQPPIGQPFLAWMPPAEGREWIAELPEDLQERVADYLRTYGSVVRQRGYSIGLDDLRPGRPSVSQKLAERPNDRDLRESLLQQFFEQLPDYAVLEFEPDAVYNIGNIAVPVFDPDGRVAFCLTLLHLGEMDGRSIPVAAQPVIASAQLLTRQIGGRAPSHDWAETL